MIGTQDNYEAISLCFQVTQLTGSTVIVKKIEANDWSVHWFQFHELISYTSFQNPSPLQLLLFFNPIKQKFENLARFASCFLVISVKT
jgi:hypothetical protein